MFQFLAITQTGCCQSFPRHLLHKITTLVIWTIAALVSLEIYVHPVNAEQASRPNIVLILADDMGFSDLGCYGGEIQTPNLDRLAERGVRFTQFYNTSKCFTSRACLLTGAYAQQVGMGGGPGKLQHSVTLAQVLKQAGYRTLMVGKHHGTQNPVDFGFDRYFGLRDGACNYFNPGAQRPGEAKPAQKSAKRAWCIDGETFAPYTPAEKDFYTTDYFTKYALDYLDQYKDEERPFFLYVAYNAPHDPLMAWPEDIARYRGKYRAGWEPIRAARYARQQKMGLLGKSAPLSAEEFGDWSQLSAAEQDQEDLRMAVYAAMVDRMDQNIGKLLDKIRALGKEENTLVLFASDNGGSAEVVNIGSDPLGTIGRWSSVKGDWANVSNTPFRKWKNFSHEGGICTPLIAYWPAGVKKPGSIVDAPGHFVDVMATVVELADAEYPAQHAGEPVVPLQGVSLRPAIAGEPIPPRGPIYWQWRNGRAVRSGAWKAVSLGRNWELYNMDEDRTETNNLAASEPARLAELTSLWDKWIVAVGGKKPASKRK